MSSTQQLLLGEGAGGGGPVTYIEDVFSTYLYTGTGASNNIINGIEFSTKGGLVWLKNRGNTNNHFLFDTVRGGSSDLSSNTTGAVSGAAAISFLSNGFNCAQSGSNTNQAGANYVSWSFEKAPKFFDVVTYTGNGSARTIAHNLGSAPGCIIIKCLNDTFDWIVWHRSFAANNYNAFLNTTDAAGAYSVSSSTAPTDTVFSLTTSPYTNQNGSTYVAYLFAHDAGGFGAAGTDNVISCGSYTLPASGTLFVDLGYEPQWLMIKRTDATGNWNIVDNMRGFTNGNANQPALLANTTAAETSVGVANLFSNGFGRSGFGVAQDYIYIAIRRGPMKVPTSGTSVFGLNARTGTNADATVTGSAGVSDAVLVKNRGSAVASLFSSRLTGTGYLVTSTEALEVAAGTTILQASPWDVMDGVKVGTSSTITNASSNTYINYLFDRAPSFFDVVCYTGTSSARTISHNLTVVPEMMIVKKRSGSEIDGWFVYSSVLGASSYVRFNSVNASAATATFWNATTPTASVFSLGNSTSVNASGSTYIWYGFTTCAGVSKVGSYTGTATTLQIDCGFTAGARFVLIKRTNNTGDWYLWDSARGIVSGNDPYFLLNSTAAEVTNTDYIDTYSAGFEISSTAPAAINSSGGTFIFLAIA